ncbi:MAG: homoserine dehydrogenase [Nitrospinota bacterium]
MKTLNIGLIGLGVVGTGLVRIVNANQQLLQEKIGAKLNIAMIGVKDIDKKRDIETGSAIITTDFNEIINNEKIDIIVELVGGIEPALTIATATLKKKLPLVTANKALLAACSTEIFTLANEVQRPVLYEAAVAGVIPIIRSLSFSFAAEELTAMYGIVNGTCNYVLTQMSKKNSSYKDALEDAKQLGFAESDPTLDVNGQDSAHKMALLASIGYNRTIDCSKIYVEGIENIELIDIEIASEFNMTLKLFGIAQKVGDDYLDIRVHPAMAPLDHPIANIDGSLNAISLNGKFIGQNLLVGPGAGSNPTASAVLGDIIEIANGISKSNGNKYLLGSRHAITKSAKILPIEQIQSEYYIRFQVPDRPGALASLTKPLGEHNISVESMIQRGREYNRPVSVVLTTHTASEKDLNLALSKIEKSKLLLQKPVVIRMLM